MDQDAPKDVTLKRILADKIVDYIKAFSDQMRLVEFIVLLKAMLCGTEKAGVATYYCLSCGAVKRVTFTCKSRLCSKCGKIANEKYAVNFSNTMLPVSHRHITWGIPDKLWHLSFQGTIKPDSPSDPPISPHPSPSFQPNLKVSQPRDRSPIRI